MNNLISTECFTKLNIEFKLDKETSEKLMIHFKEYQIQHPYISLKKVFRVFIHSFFIMGYKELDYGIYLKKASTNFYNTELYLTFRIDNIDSKSIKDKIVNYIINKLNKL